MYIPMSRRWACCMATYLACYPEDKERERNEEQREEGTKENMSTESGIRKTDEEIRALDKNTLLMDHATLNSLADSLFGKTEKDLWYVIRSTLCWKVSHTPIRLLTQLKRYSLTLQHTHTHLKLTTQNNKGCACESTMGIQSYSNSR